MANLPRLLKSSSSPSKLLLIHRHHHGSPQLSLLQRWAALGISGRGGSWIGLVPSSRALSCLTSGHNDRRGETSPDGQYLFLCSKVRSGSSTLWLQTARSTTTSVATTSAPALPAATTKDNLDLTFQDARAAFRSKSTGELLRAYFVFYLCTFRFLVDNNMKLMHFGQKILGKTLFNKLMELSFYGHFVAGANEFDIQPKIERLRQFGVKAILDYSVEEDISQEEATKLEIEGCGPPTAPGGTSPDPASSELKEQVLLCDYNYVEEGNWMEELDDYKQYHAHANFGDRRDLVKSARTFFYMNEAQCERNMEIFLQSIEAVSGATKGTGFAAVKITALGRPQLLLQLSEAIARVHRYVKNVTGKSGPVLEQNLKAEDLQRKLERAAKADPTVKSWIENMTSDSTGLIHLLPWQGVIEAQKKLRDVMKVADLSTGKMERLMPPLTDQEEEMFMNMMRRLHTVFKVATKMDVRVMVDAEQTYFQPAISRITMEMMRIYNKEKAFVFNTYQCYLKEALHSLVTDLEQAERQNFYFGAKLVRGAYMEQERLRAQSLGYEDPINPDYEATSAMYHSCMIECLKRIKSLKDAGQPKKIAIMAATHNEDTVRFTIQKMKEFEIQPLDRVICFGQLYGMCDQISFPLGQSGYSVYKYVPYGPVDGVLPYLSRRAQENRGLISKTEKERRLLFKELTRRCLKGQFFYRPVGHYEPL